MQVYTKTKMRMDTWYKYYGSDVDRSCSLRSGVNRPASLLPLALEVVSDPVRGDV